MLTRGFESSSDTRLHFGMDSANFADSILIVWPDEKYQVLKRHKDKWAGFSKSKEMPAVFSINASYFKASPELFTDITKEVNSSWRHHENEFFDYNVQYLIPHAESTRGPKIAVADVNKDGLDDFYVCGESGQPGELDDTVCQWKIYSIRIIIGRQDSAYRKKWTPFFDADNDSYPDLYVVSGGNIFENGNPGLRDNLYLNDRKGNFKQVLNAIPKIARNKSCVSAADVDKDGDIDLFVGGLANSKAYGVPESSYLLLNDGNGTFKLADSPGDKIRQPRHSHQLILC